MSVAHCCTLHLQSVVSTQCGNFSNPAIRFGSDTSTDSQYPIIFRLLIFAIFTSFCLLFFCRDVYAEIALTNEDFQALCDQQPSMSQTKLESSLGEYIDAVRATGITTQKIVEPELDFLESLLERATALNWGIGELLTESVFTTAESCVLFIGSDVLKKIDQFYNLHSLWMINALSLIHV